MSNFLQKAIHPKTGNIEPAQMLDDCFGHHRYGVLFRDGSLYQARDVDTVLGNVDVEFDEFDSTTAYKKAERIMSNRKQKKNDNK